MKTKLFLLSLTCLISLGITAQDFTSSNNVLLEMKSASSAGVLDALDKYELETDREKKLFSRNTDSLRVMIQHYACQIYYAGLTQKEVKLADKDALRDLVTYSKGGYPTMVIPKSVIKRLVKNGHEADYYFSLAVSVELYAGFGSLSSGVKPAISCDIKVFSPDREIVKKVNHRYRSKVEIKSWDFPERKFDKLAYDHIMILAKRLEPAVKTAILEAVAQL